MYVSFSCERKSERIERKFETQNPIPSPVDRRAVGKVEYISTFGEEKSKRNSKDKKSKKRSKRDRSSSSSSSSDDGR